MLETRRKMLGRITIGNSMHGFECNLDVICASEFFKDLKKHESEGRVPFEVFVKLTSALIFIQISQEAMLLQYLLIKMFETIVVLTYAFIANILLAMKVFLALLYHIIQR
jgi:hypothetical protein